MRERFAQPTSPPPPFPRIQATPKDERFGEFLEVIEKVGEKGLREISKVAGIKPVKVKELLKRSRSKD